MSEPARKPELPPELPEFIRKHGGYANVTPEGWRASAGLWFRACHSALIRSHSDSAVTCNARFRPGRCLTKPLPLLTHQRASRGLSGLLNPDLQDRRGIL